MAYFRCGGGVPSSVKTLPTYKTASGSVANFETDMTENLISCVCDFSASGGGGTPLAPIAISGVSAVNVSDNDKNYLAKPFVYFNTAPTTLSEYFPLKAGNYVISFNSVTGATSWRFNIRMKDKSGNDLSSDDYQPSNQLAWNNTVQGWINGVNVTFTSLAFTIVEDCLVRFTFSTGDTSASTVFSDVMLNTGTTIQPYEPYTGTTATCNLGDTYYGGSVDVVTGKIIKTYKIVDLGSLNWTYSTDATRFYSDVVTNIKAPSSGTDLPDIICDIYSPRTFNQFVGQGENNTITVSTSARINCRNTDYTDGNVFRTAMTGHKAVFALATPIVAYASNSLEIPTINGTNNIFADTGNINCKYILSVGEALRQS